MTRAASSGAGDGALFLGIDVGTQSTKAVLVDVDARSVVARAQVSYGLIEGLADGAAEQDPRTWIDAVIGSVRRVLEDGARAGRGVAGMGVSGQQHGAVLVDGTRTPVRTAKLWCDTETAAEAQRLSRELGRTIPAGFTAPKLRFVADREPHVWARVAHVLLPHDFVNAWLSERVFSEVGDASGTGYLDPVTGAYDERAMDATAPGLAGMVPELLPCDAVAGELGAVAAEALGLPPGLPISAGGGDNMMSAIGSGATRPGVVTCSLGTSGTVFAFHDRALVDPGGAIAAFRASSATIRASSAPPAATMPAATMPAGTAAAGHLPLLCVMNCTAPLEALRALTGLSHAELTERAARVEPAVDGALFVPFLVGERTPNLPNARGLMTGMDLATLTPGGLYRATLEGVGCNLAAGLDRMRALGLRPSEVRLVGGASTNPLWRQILADLFQVNVQSLAESETAAVGAAIQAACAVQGREVDRVASDFIATHGDVVSPNPSRVEAHASLRRRFDESVARLGA